MTTSTLSTFGTSRSDIVIGPAFPYWGLVQAICTTCDAQLIRTDGACWCPPGDPAAIEAALEVAAALAEYRFTSAEYRAEIMAPASDWEA